jgi:secreted trypsin-like serine protease
MRRLGATLLGAGALVLGVSAPAAANDTRIVGGAATSISNFPWQVALADSQAINPGNGFARQFCGGTLVAPTIVITAAHCVYEFNPVPALTCTGVGEGFNFPASDFAVFTGRTTLSSSEGEEINVAEIYYFEGSASNPTLQRQSADPDTATGQLYDCDPGQWDAVFLQLASPSTTGVPIKIAGADEAGLWAPGQPALISGWGRTVEGGSKSDQLKAAQISMLSDTDCGNVYGGSFIASTMVCAGVLAGGTDTCQGDSGGPLVVQGFQRSSRAANTVRLVGDTSFGIGCARPAIPGVYGRLAADPMRSAFRNGILQVAGVDVVGSGALAPETTPPVAKIGKHPKKQTEKRTAKFTFSANEESSFQCKLDRGAFKACSSPFKKRVSAKKHKFRVQATDVQGNVGAVDRFKWRVFR